MPVVALAQKEPRLGYVYPAGGCVGTTFRVTVGGQYFIGATNVLFSGTGIRAAIIEQDQQLTPKEQQDAKERLSLIQKKRKAGEQLTARERDEAEEIKKKLDAFARRRANPALGEFVTLRVSVSSNAPPGNREVRLATHTGLSNPRVFCIGRLPEVSKDDWKDVPKNKFTMDPKIDPKPPEVTIKLPVTINGQVPPGCVDSYRFAARAGQNIVVVVRARELIPYLADAVPGWLQTTATLYDSSEQEQSSFEEHRGTLDPVLCYRISRDGNYVLAVRDSLYRGREDFIYRITVGELPFVTGIFPLGGKTDTKTTFQVTGWNLPLSALTIDFSGRNPGLYPVPFVTPGRFSNPVPVAVCDLPEYLENEPVDVPDKARRIQLPVVINGRIDKPGDLDVYRFEAKAGDQVVAEVLARRLESPLDSILTITDSKGTELASNDDHEDKASGLNTHHADSYLSVLIPTNGDYSVQIGDAQHNGGQTYGYRLRISAPQPDFELRVVPSTVSVRGGTSVPLTVYALRQDGFAGEIALALKNAPKGFSLSSARVPPKEDRVKLTLNAGPSQRMDPVSLYIEGRATIEGRTVTRDAVPADDMMQAFAYRHLVPAQNLEVAVVGRFKTWDSAKILTPMPVKLPVGGTARVQLSMPTGRMIGKIEFKLVEAPDGVTIKSSSPSGMEIVLQADATKVKQGQKGNLIVEATGEKVAQDEKVPSPAKIRRVPLGAFPAITFEIAPSGKNQQL